MDARSCRKAELHCHLDGLISPEAARALQARGLLADLDVAQFQALYPVTSFASWRAIGEFQDPFLHGNHEVLRHLMLDYLRTLLPQQVTYAEIMLSSFLGIEFDELVAALKRYRAAADELTGIDLGLIWALGRRAEPSAMEPRIYRVMALYELDLVDGLAIAGDEAACTIRDLAGLFDELQERGIPVEIHAGEWCGPESIWDALQYGHPRRIGHALCLFDDPELPNYVEKHRIHLEFCPTSNLKVAGLSRIEDHPIFRALERDISFSINSDDPGHFECTMDSEFARVNSIRPLSAADCERIYQNTIGAAFRQL